MHFPLGPEKYVSGYQFENSCTYITKNWIYMVKATPLKKSLWIIDSRSINVLP